MGYDQNNAGLHLIPRGNKGSSETFQPFDKYGAIIAENHMKNKYADQKILEDVKLCNFISLADKRGQLKQCVCGGKYKYVDNLVIRFHRAGKMSSVQMPGKICIDCERKMAVKSELLSKINYELKETEISLLRKKISFLPTFIK